MDMKDMKVNKTAVAITAGTVGGLVAVGALAVWVYNTRQMKTLRMIKRASRIMYHVGTAMRNISGEGAM